MQPIKVTSISINLKIVNKYQEKELLLMISSTFFYPTGKKINLMDLHLLGSLQDKLFMGSLKKDTPKELLPSFMTNTVYFWQEKLPKIKTGVQTQCS